MSGVNRPSKPAVAAARPHDAIHPHRVLMALLVVAIFICAVAGVVVMASMGQTTAALVIALVAGGSFCTAALC
jgi:hypothetical protein